METPKAATRPWHDPYLIGLHMSSPVAQIFKTEKDAFVGPQGGVAAGGSGVFLGVGGSVCLRIIVGVGL